MHAFIPVQMRMVKPRHQRNGFRSSEPMKCRHFIAGHEAQEMHMLGLPEKGTTLTWKAVITISSHGQAFAWDRAEVGLLYFIRRKTDEVIVSRIDLT
jgi:hypothetical protein